MIIQTVNEYDFVNAFTEIRPNNFSRMALFAMYEYLDDLSEDIGQPIELDVIGLCCEFSEIYLQDVVALYGLEEYDHLKDNNEAVMEWLQERTQVIEVDLDEGLVIIQDF